MGSVSCISARETCAAHPGLERAVGLCQDGTFRSSCRSWPQPWAWRIPWRDVTLRVWRWWNKGWRNGRQGQTEASALRALCLSEAYLLAGRLEDARQRAAQAVDLARQYQQRGTQAWALWLLGESTARQTSPEGASAAGHYRQALALAEELGMRPLQAHCHHGLGMLYARTGQQAAGACRPGGRHRPVPRHGDDFLATPGGGNAGAGEPGRIVEHGGNPAPVVMPEALAKRLLPPPNWWGNASVAGRIGRRRRWAAALRGCSRRGRSVVSQPARQLLHSFWFDLKMRPRTAVWAQHP